MNDKNEKAVYKPDSHWHLSRAITLGTLFAIAVLFGTQIYTFGEQQQKLTSLETQVMMATNDRIHRTTVIEMFNSRDIQIANLSKQIAEMRYDVKETNRILQEILRVMPRPKAHSTSSP